MKICTIVGARPQFIKAAPLSRALAEDGHVELLIHTGQHYDDQMSEVFFRELGIPHPSVNLQVGSGPHGWQTAQMLQGIEESLLLHQPDLCVLFGDTNSTLAGALAACKLHIPIAHIEAGLRSFNRTMPEEHNRVLTDHCSDLLFCPNEGAVQQLAREGITQGVHNVGDIMYDAALHFGEIARSQSQILERLHLDPEDYILCTVHRPYNTDSAEALGAIFRALQQLDRTVVVPVHPRTRTKLSNWGIEVTNPRVKLIDPVGYLDMLRLEMDASLIITDSGGVQKEAFFFRRPCLTLRPETEWTDTVRLGWNRLCQTDTTAILQAIEDVQTPTATPENVFGDGNSATRMAKLLSML